MAIIMDPRTEMPYGELCVYDSIINNLPGDIIAYHNREVNGLQFDFCLVIKNVGLVVIEVKGWEAKNILKVVSPDEIHTNLYKSPVASPKKQARGYRFSLLNHFNNRYDLNPLIMDMVCYPFITESQFVSTRLNIVSEANTTLFKEDIADAKRFSQKILNAYRQISQANYDKISGKNYEIIRRYFEAEYNSNSEDTVKTPYSELRIYPSSMNLTEIDEVISAFLQGTKQVVFVNDPSSQIELKKNLEAKLNAVGVLVNGKQLVVKSNPQNSINSLDTGFSLFNFECYLVPNLGQYFEKYTVVKNGQKDESAKLEELAGVTNFNYQQYLIEHAAVDSDIQVKAGAGTGKTFSMISRISFICHLSSNSGVLDPSEEIAMLTFTTDAAINMKKRLKAQFMNYFVLTKDKRFLSLVGNIERMRISTIHSFAKTIMQNTSLPLGIGTDFSTVTGQYQRQRIFHKIFNNYLTEINKEHSTFFFNLPVSMYDFEKKLLRLSQLLYNKGFDVKNSAIDAFGAPVEDMPYLLEIIEKVVKQTEIEYSRYLFDNNAVNLGEYMVYLNRCIQDESFNTNLYKFKYIFVDEFQDVDDSQISAFLEMQKKLGFKFFIVGDLKQSIYRFRGATMDAFSKMGCGKDQWLTFGLNTNYRSDKRLLSQYDVLFTEMGQNGFIPYKSNQDALVGVKCTEPLEEDELLATKIVYTADDIKDGQFYDKLFGVAKERKSILENRMRIQKLSPAERTIAILVRTNKDISDVLYKSREYDIVVESDAGGDLYRLQSTIDLCKLTSALTHPYNPVYLFDLIESNNVNIAFSVEAIVGLTDSEKTEKMVDCLSQYYKMVLGMTWEELIKNVQSRPVLMMLRKIYEATKPWKAESTNIERQMHYRTNYELLFEELTRTNRKSYLTLDAINEALHISISTGTDAKSRELIDAVDYVKVICTTVHRSKGLEYDSVILPFTTDKIDVLRRNALDVTYVDGKVGYMLNLATNPVINEYFITENEVQETKMEEARILYVALTRAINRFVWFEKESGTGTTWGSILEELDVCQ